jgi:hypothetical protein
MAILRAATGFALIFRHGCVPGAVRVPRLAVCLAERLEMPWMALRLL